MTPIRVQTRSAVLAIAAIISAMAVAGCGTTYVDTSITVADTAPASPDDDTDGTDNSDVVVIADDTPLDDLLGEIETLMSDLDQRVVDGNGTHETMAQIDALWHVAEAQIRAIDPDDVYNFEQAIELARSGVERNRPADPSKGYKIFVDVSDRYLAAR